MITLEKLYTTKPTSKSGFAKNTPKDMKMKNQTVDIQSSLIVVISPLVLNLKPSCVRGLIVLQFSYDLEFSSSFSTFVILKTFCFYVFSPPLTCRLCLPCRHKSSLISSVRGL